MKGPVCCERQETIETLKKYDPQPKNKSGSVRWYLYRWDDGKRGYRKLVRCGQCGALYLVQAYQLHLFSGQSDTWFEDWYRVASAKQADDWNRSYTGLQLEHQKTAAFHRRIA